MEELAGHTPATDPCALGLPAAPADAWTDEFRRSIQFQHVRVREFIQALRDRWREVRCELERQIAELSAEVASLRAAAGMPPAEAGGGALPATPHEAPAATLDWEAEKRRILGALESDPLGHSATPEEQQRKIEEIVRRTDRLLAEKDGEIERLRALLAQGGAAARAAPVPEGILDQDAVICQQREYLEQLERHWREKLRQAEIELSLERAKIARQQAEIEERLRMLDDQSREDGAAEAAGLATRPPRGRWLARLGLSDADGKPGG